MTVLSGGVIPMRLAHTIEARLQQTQRIDPRQILASEILAWTTAELESAVEREIAENPALEIRDDGVAAAPAPAHAEWSPSGVLNGIVAPETPGRSEGPRSTLSAAQPVGGAWEEDDPLDRVASNLTLHDHLRAQVGQVASGATADLVRYLIECVDDRGYLVADLADVAERFRVPPAMVSQAVRALQAMEPAGVGARDIRECLTLQAEYLHQAGECHPLILRILNSCWEELVSRREERIAARLRAPLPDVRGAVSFLQKALTPYPGGAFRTAGQTRNGNLPAIRPDIIFHRGEAGFVVELTRDFETMLLVAPLWKRLAERPETGADESMRRYIRDHVERVQTFLTGVTRRGQTLRRIARELVECQQGYLETSNRAFLRPLTRQAIAERLGLDESVISRAVAEKWAQLPGGEIVPLDAFFGNAHAVRDALAQLIAGEDPAAPYSDDEIADILTAQGFPLARRTVAKYRGLEKILPARLRKRETVSQPHPKAA
jgi:RNA polymerase sigma-54 factor